MSKDEFKVRRDMLKVQRELGKRIKSIPKDNKLKFLRDLDKLIDLAHGSNYGNFSFWS